MKKIITIVAVLMFVFAIGAVIADEKPIMTDTGTMLYNESLEHPKRFQGDVLYTPQDMLSPTAKKDFSVRSPIATDAQVETGTALYNAAFPIDKPMVAERSAEGAAAGGVVREDENTRIWDNLLAPTGASLE